jgi:hypothetical protein
MLLKSLWSGFVPVRLRDVKLGRKSAFPGIELQTAADKLRRTEEDEVSIIKKEEASIIKKDFEKMSGR